MRLRSCLINPRDVGPSGLCYKLFVFLHIFSPGLPGFFPAFLRTPFTALNICRCGPELVSTRTSPEKRSFCIHIFCRETLSAMSCCPFTHVFNGMLLFSSAFRTPGCFMIWKSFYVVKSCKPSVTFIAFPFVLIVCAATISRQTYSAMFCCQKL